MAILFYASRFKAWTFVDNVDIVDARFKSARVAAFATRSDLLGINPYINIFNFSC